MPNIGLDVIVASFLINLMALAMPIVLLQIFDRVVPNQSEATLGVLFTGLVVVLILDHILKSCRIVLLGHKAAKFEIALTDKVVRRILEAQPRATGQITAGSFLDKLGGITQLRDHYGGQGRLLAVDLPFVAIFIFMIWLIGGPLVAVPLGGLAVLLVFTFVLRKMQAPALARRMSVDQRRYSFLIEVLTAALTVKSQSMEQQMIRRYEMLQDQSSQASAGLIRVSGFTQAFGAVFGQAAVVAMAGLGAVFVIQGVIGMAELAACMLLNGRTSQPLLKILSLWVQVETLRTSRDKVEGLLKLPPAQTEAPVRSPISGHIRFDNVSFEVTGRSEPIFADLSFEAQPGQAVVFLGKDGGGKSSAAKMLIGEIAPSKGTVHIDGLPPETLAHQKAIGAIGYAGPAPVIFNGSIIDNLSLFGDAEARDKSVAIAEEIGLGPDIHRLPLGYDTILGAGGMQSATVGFLQRIALARVLARDPKLLVFNEANSAMDMESDQLVINKLNAMKGASTLVIISRRPSYMRLADLTVPIPPDPNHEAQLQDWKDDAKRDTGGPLRLTEKSA